jgi:hypothetical protein
VPFSECDVAAVNDAPLWFGEEEVPRFERFCSDGFLAHMKDELGLQDPAKAREFARRERFSSKLRGLTPFEIDTTPTDSHRPAGDFRLDHLVPEFMHFRQELTKIVSATKSSIENLHLTQFKTLDVKRLLRLFADAGFYRAEGLMTQLETLMRYVEGPAKKHWGTVPAFETRWTKEAQDCRSLVATTGRLRDELDKVFARLLEKRYGEIVPKEILPADLFYEKFMADRRRQADGKPRKAVVLVIDSMRLDIWRELIRPALERDYEVEEDLGFALLPSETRVSRRSLFAGLPPGSMGAGRESDLFGALLKRVHGAAAPLEDVSPSPAGMTFAVRTKDQSTYAGVFDFWRSVPSRSTSAKAVVVGVGGEDVFGRHARL